MPLAQERAEPVTQEHGQAHRYAQRCSRRARQARRELKRTAARLSSALLENTALGNRNRGLETCREQLEAIYKAQRERSTAGPFRYSGLTDATRTNRRTGAAEASEQRAE